MTRIIAVAGHAPDIDEDAFVADGATVAGDVSLAAGASVWFGTVIRAERAGVTIGPESNLQDLCVVHTDEGFPTTIGARVTVGHRAILHGCTVEDDALIGMGAVVLNGATIGEGAVVGAGAVVREGMQVPARSLVVGVPARVLEGRQTPPPPRPNVASYVEAAAWYREA